jgi:hypothetical protein
MAAERRARTTDSITRTSLYLPCPGGARHPAARSRPKRLERTRGVGVRQRRVP